MARFGRRGHAVGAHERQTTLFARFDDLARRVQGSDARRPALALLGTVLGLLGIGLLIQLSHAATTLPVSEFRAELLHVLEYRVLAIVVLLAAFRLGPTRMQPFVPLLVVLAIAGLVAVFVPSLSRAVNGSQRWIQVPFTGLTVQPSEIARVVMVLWVADRCRRLGPLVEDMRRGFLPMLLFGITLFCLIVQQPDLGGALLFLMCFVATMWVGGARPAHVAGSLGLAGGGALVLAISTLAYVRERIAVWIGGSGNDQVHRAVDAMASGNWFGVGLTHGGWRNSGLQYMQNDYAFSLIGEELGLFGQMTVVGLFLAFAWFALRLVLSLRDRFCALVAFGLLTSIAFQAVLHLQVVTGLAPPKGINLPFISAGGTSLVASCLAVGLALGGIRSPADRRAPARSSSLAPSLGAV